MKMKGLFSAILLLIVGVLVGLYFGIQCQTSSADWVVRDGEWHPVTESETRWDGIKRGNITYQLLVYSFTKEGNFKGLMDRLDYIDQLGASAILLSPIHPAEAYHGYDVIDYDGVNPDYGTADDFDTFIKAAHARGIKVYLDFVMNHVSVKHPWFEEAVRDPSSAKRGWFVFSDHPAEDIANGRIDMIRSEGSGGYNPNEWFPVSVLGESQSFYHSHFNTPTFADLNYGPIENLYESKSFRAVVDAAKGWIDRGVDGFRLDAVKHIYHSATSDENPRFLRTFYGEVNRHYRQLYGNDIYMVGEVLDNYWNVAPYYAGLPALFEFDFWVRLEWAINNSTGCYFAENIKEYQNRYATYRGNYIEATKLSNHDEDRTASRFGMSEDKMRLAAAVLLTSAGEPYIYYGEEVGMMGTKERGDEYVRQPFPWQEVDNQTLVPTSLLTSYRQLCRLRNATSALADGVMSVHPVYNSSDLGLRSIAAWYMSSRDGRKKLLVMHNFASTEVTLRMVDNVERCILVMGDISSRSLDGDSWLRLGGYSSVVFVLE